MIDSVRKNLDTCLGHNEKGLIDEILDFIDGKICSRCGCLDTIHGFRTEKVRLATSSRLRSARDLSHDHLCKICNQKRLVVKELDQTYGAIRCFGSKCSNFFPTKLVRYIIEFQTIEFHKSIKSLIANIANSNCKKT